MQILDRFDELKLLCDGWRERGETIVFTNGCFDLVHAGHVDSLERAKALGTKLVVGLNSDESVAKLKGPSRPLVPLVERMRLIAALRSVDAVCPFHEDTPKQIIEIVQPHVVAKGGDYKVHEIVGHEFVLPRGGRCLSLPIVPGLSTTNIVEKIKNEA